MYFRKVSFMRIKKLPGFAPEELCISCGRPEPSPLLAIWSLHLWGVGFGLLDDLEPVVLKKLAERPPNSEILSKCISAELRPQEWALRWAIPREDAITLDKMGSPLARPWPVYCYSTIRSRMISGIPITIP